MQILGRTINLRSLIAQRMNKTFRENLEFLFDRFESQDLCAVVVSFFFLILYVLPLLVKYTNFISAGTGEAHRYPKAFAWTAFTRSYNRSFQPHAEWNARKHLACLIFQPTCYTGQHTILYVIIKFRSQFFSFFFCWALDMVRDAEWLPTKLHTLQYHTEICPLLEGSSYSKTLSAFC